MAVRGRRKREKERGKKIDNYKMVKNKRFFPREREREKKESHVVTRFSKPLNN